ncbi:signal transduction histidine kinase [Marmoricola sp. URHA0025 HA25]
MRRLETPLIALVAILLTAVPSFFTDAVDGASWPHSGPDWIGWGALVASAMSLVLWRRHPGWTLVVGCGGTLVCTVTNVEPSDAGLVILPTLALVGAYSWGGRTAIAVGLGLLIWLEALYLATGETGPALAIFTLPGYIGGVVLRRVHETAAQLELRSRELEEERGLFAELSVRNERTRIASELHDIIGHALSVMVVQAAAGQRLAARDPAATTEAFEVIAESARRGREDLGRLVDLLGGEPVEAPDLSLIDEVISRAARSGLAVTCRFEGDRDGVPAPVAHAAFRVVQEGLTNALRHAPGAAVQVLVRGAGRGLTVRVVNDAPSGASPGIVGTGQGLAGLRARIQQLGGSLDAGAVARGGWQLEARLPV